MGLMSHRVNFWNLETQSHRSCLAISFPGILHNFSFSMTSNFGLSQGGNLVMMKVMIMCDDLAYQKVKSPPSSVYICLNA